MLQCKHLSYATIELKAAFARRDVCHVFIACEKFANTRPVTGKLSTRMNFGVSVVYLSPRSHWSFFDSELVHICLYSRFYETAKLHRASRSVKVPRIRAEDGHTSVANVSTTPIYNASGWGITSAKVGCTPCNAPFATDPFRKRAELPTDPTGPLRGESSSSRSVAVASAFFGPHGKHSTERQQWPSTGDQ